MHWTFSPDSGVLFDGDWSNTWAEARRRISETGERCALWAVADYFMEQGYALETASGGLVRLLWGERKSEICCLDTEDFRHPGWDIKVKIQ